MVKVGKYNYEKSTNPSKKLMVVVEKDGKKIPAFAADGKGKMAKGGMAKKGYANGGVAKKKTKTKSKGKVRGAGIAKKGVRKCKMR